MDCLKFLIVIGALVFSGCAMEMVKVDQSTLAYITIDTEKEESQMCFDTISKNNCIDGVKEEIDKLANDKNKISYKQGYILIIGKPLQMDCCVDKPSQCRLYFNHIDVSLTMSEEEKNYTLSTL